MDFNLPADLPEPAELDALQQQLQLQSAGDEAERFDFPSEEGLSLEQRGASADARDAEGLYGSLLALRSPPYVQRADSQSQTAGQTPTTPALWPRRLFQSSRASKPLTQRQGLQQPHEQPDVYPEAECSQAEVLEHKEVFYVTLHTLQDYLGVAEKVPRVGGREVDLHLLFRNVCLLGGCEAVITNKLWREASEAFSFPETITNVSFVLRKIYLSQLWDYEQVYMHGMAGQRLRPPPPSGRDGAAAAPAEPPTPTATACGRSAKRQRVGDQMTTSFVGLLTGSPTQLVASARNPVGSDTLTAGSKGGVTVDARFDAGYFVTVKIAKQEFQGILYYPPPEHTQETAAAEKGKEPGAPKPNKTPFNFFSIGARARAKEAFPELGQIDITKKVGEMWKKASKEEKAPYISMSTKDRHRYQAELEAYNYRLAAQAATQTAGEAMAAVAVAQQAMSHPSGSVGSQTYQEMGSSLMAAEEASESQAI